MRVPDSCDLRQQLFDEFVVRRDQMNDTRFVSPGSRGKLFCMIVELDRQLSRVARRQQMAARVEQTRDNPGAWSSKRNLGDGNGKARSIAGFIVDAQTGKSHRAGKEDRPGLAVVDLLPLSIDGRCHNVLLDAHTAKRGRKTGPCS